MHMNLPGSATGEQLRVKPRSLPNNYRRLISNFGLQETNPRKNGIYKERIRSEENTVNPTCEKLDFN